MSARPVESSAAGPKFRFRYFSPKPKYFAYDGLPFGAVYGAFLAALLGVVVRRGEVVFEHFLWCMLPATLHVVVFLATQWSVDARCFVRFNPQASVETASHVKVERLVKNSHKSYATCLALLQRNGTELSIEYLKKKFVFDPSSGTFERLRFDVALPLEKYVDSSGLSTEEAAAAAQRFGPNIYNIPLPTFGELFQEHAVAPFFVFQVLCVLLWLMDEYWYYALLTLVMLIVMEAQMVQRRRSDLGELRAMRIPPRPMHVHRDGAWRMIMSDHLLPGDLVAVARNAETSFPCDVLLLQGNVLANEAMLTGESVPQMKVAVSLPEGCSELRANLDLRSAHKQHIVNAGTTIMLHQNSAAKAKNVKKAPTIGVSTAAVGYVLRTGFDTTQGKLCRTILFSAERVTVQSREAMYFLVILVFFAIAACIYVLYDGLVLAPLRTDEPQRSTFKLFLSVSHILTSVVPPEFPIMLSLAVNLSLVALVQRRIFCTEPFRVPLAGRVGTCCFDKTGTLTSDSMEVGGVHGLPGFPVPGTAEAANGAEVKGDFADGGPLEQPLPFMTTAVMAACSGLTVIEGEVVGDPLERAALQSLRYHMVSTDLLSSKVGRGAERLQILCRYPFASELQRMAVVVRHQGPGRGHRAELLDASTASAKGPDFDRCLALVKGSCDALRPRLLKVPEDFDKMQDRLTKAGYRVLCLAGKVLSVEAKNVSQLVRGDVESDLEFCGLMVLRNAIKPEVAKTIRQLRKSYHRVLMITGDHPLTACQVAAQVDMSEGKFLMLEVAEGQSGMQQANGDGKVVATAAEVSNGKSPHGPCALEWRARDDPGKPPKAFSLEKVRDLARKYTLCVPGWTLKGLSDADLKILAPNVTVFARVSPQQKEQVVTALNHGSHTVMVGDGTNDVGALKHAHVGISLMMSAPPVRLSGKPGESLDDRAPLVRLGDASIASPFTYKGDSIKCCLHILRCGRATLSTVLMMYKIMGLNSVMSAFAMSVLTLDGVKLGDTQTTIESLYISMCFFLVSRSAPAKDLSKQRPNGSVFAWHVLLGLALQLVVHIGVLYTGWKMAVAQRPSDFKKDIEGEFAPNLTNTVVFDLVAVMHAASFLANYEGHPFMQPMVSNKALSISLGIFIASLFLLTSEAIPELNEELSLVAFPDAAFRSSMLQLVTLDLVLSVGLSRLIGQIAMWFGSRAAERHAQDWGLGLPASEGREGRGSKKAKEA